MNALSRSHGNDRKRPQRRRRTVWLALWAISFLLLLGSISSVQSAVLAEWNFNGGSSDYAASGVPVSLTASVFALGSGLQKAGTTYGINSSVEGVGGTDPVVFPATSAGTSEANALSNLAVMTFSLTPQSGFALSLTEISFYAWSNTNFPDNGQAYHYFVRTNVTGTTTLGTYDSSEQIENGTAPTAAIHQYSLPLSGFSALQNQESTIEFTIGVYTTGTGITGNFRIDSIQIQGVLQSVPEPSRGLLFLAAMAMAVCRRHPVRSRGNCRFA